MAFARPTAVLYVASSCFVGCGKDERINIAPAAPDASIVCRDSGAPKIDWQVELAPESVSLVAGDAVTAVQVSPLAEVFVGGRAGARAFAGELTRAGAIVHQRRFQTLSAPARAFAFDSGFVYAAGGDATRTWVAGLDDQLSPIFTQEAPRARLRPWPEMWSISVRDGRIMIPLLERIETVGTSETPSNGSKLTFRYLDKNSGQLVDLVDHVAAEGVHEIVVASADGAVTVGREPGTAVFDVIRFDSAGLELRRDSVTVQNCSSCRPVAATAIGNRAWILATSEVDRSQILFALDEESEVLSTVNVSHERLLSMSHVTANAGGTVAVVSASSDDGASCAATGFMISTYRSDGELDWRYEHRVDAAITTQSTAIDVCGNVIVGGTIAATGSSTPRLWVAAFGRGE
jgi:hypothetical protein